MRAARWLDAAVRELRRVGAGPPAAVKAAEKAAAVILAAASQGELFAILPGKGGRPDAGAALGDG